MLRTLLALLLVSTAARADWTYFDRPPFPAPVFGVVAASDVSTAGVADSFWTFARAESGTGSRLALTRYASDGSLVSWRYVTASGGSPFTIWRLPDDGVFASVQYLDRYGQAQSCTTLRNDAGGSLRWSSSNLGRCLPVLGIDGDGGIMQQYGATNVQRIASDGSATVGFGYPIGSLMHVTDGSSGAMHFVPAPDRAGAYVGFGNTTVSNPTPQSLAFVAADGTVTTLYQSPTSDIRIDRVSVAPDGNLFATGHMADGTLGVFSVTPSGQLRWSRTYPAWLEAAGESQHLHDGRLVSFDRNGLLLVLSPTDGNVLHSLFLPVTAPCAPAEPFHCLHIAANDDIVVDYATGINAVTRVTARYDAAGTLLAQAQADSPALSSTVLLGTGSAVTVSAVAADSAAGARRIDRTGPASSLTLPAPTAVADNAGLDGIVDSTGSTSLLTAGASGLAMTRLGDDGSLAWQRLLAPGGPAFASLQPGTQRVCALATTPPDIACFSATDGTPLWDRSLGASASVLAWRVYDDNHVTAVVHDDAAASTMRVTISAQGDVTSTPLANGSLGQAAIAADGSVTLFEGATVERYLPDGTRRYSVALNYNGSNWSVNVYDILPLPDGSVLATATVEHNVGAFIWHLDANGATRWVQDDGSTPRVFDATTAYSSGSTILTALNLADGSKRWTVDLSASLTTYARISGLRWSGDGSTLIADASAAMPHALLVDPADGTVTRHAFASCANCNSSRVLDVDSRQRLRALAYASDPATGARAEVTAVDLAVTAAPAGQLAMQGAWYAPYETGQGFVIDFTSGAKAFSAAWFTYPGGGGSKAYYDNVSWFTLQGGGDGDDGLDLTIYANDTGHFAAAADGALPTGTAHIRFVDCNHAELTYAFTGSINRGRQGVIGLQRLTPSTQPCRRLDGSEEPAQSTRAPANGFDTLQSGAWYDPTASGQGFELSVLPETAADGGLLFGAWFTFNPLADLDFGNASHRWFTLQGSLAGATDGSVTVPIFQTVGGMFDYLPTHNVVQVGHAAVAFADCTHATIDYAFDTSEAARAYAGLTGHIALVKIGGCSVP